MPEFYEEEHTDVLARVVWARRRPGMLWLGGAALSFTVAFAITWLAPSPAGVHGAAMQALQHEADEIGPRTLQIHRDRRSGAGPRSASAGPARRFRSDDELRRETLLGPGRIDARPCTLTSSAP